MNVDMMHIPVGTERQSPMMDAALRDDGRFRDALNAQVATDEHAPESDRRAKARDAAEQFVASAFILPVFKMMQESMLEMEGPFAPGLAEERFMPMLHQKFADQIVQASSFDLVEAVVDRIAGPEAPVIDGTAETKASSQGVINVVA